MQTVSCQDLWPDFLSIQIHLEYKMNSQQNLIILQNINLKNVYPKYLYINHKGVGRDHYELTMNLKKCDNLLFIAVVAKTRSSASYKCTNAAILSQQPVVELSIYSYNV